MLDTVQFTILASPRPGKGSYEYLEEEELPPGWQWSHSGNGTTFTSNDFGVRIFLGGHASVIRATLPKVLWGHNARLIATDEELSLALRWVEFLAWCLVEPPMMFGRAGFVPGLTRYASGHFTEIHLARNFPKELGIVSAMRTAEHEKIRARPKCYGLESTVLEGSMLRITAYDKNAEMRRLGRNLPPVERLEVQIKSKGRQLYAYASGHGETSLNLQWCRETLWKIAQELDARPMLASEGKIEDVLAYWHATQFGIPFVDDYARIRKLSPKRRNRLIRDVNRRARALKLQDCGSAAFCNAFRTLENGQTVPISIPEIEAVHMERCRHVIEWAWGRFKRWQDPPPEYLM